MLIRLREKSANNTLSDSVGHVLLSKTTESYILTDVVLNRPQPLFFWT